MTFASAVVTLLVSVLSALALLIGTIRWVWKQAQNQSVQTSAIVRNTEATKELTEKFGLYVEKADGHLIDHEKRLTRIEDKLREQRA